MALTQAYCPSHRVSTFPPNMEESWSLHTVKRCWRQPTVLVFNNWLRIKAEAHKLMRVSQIKSRPDVNTLKTGFHKPPTKFLPLLRKLKKPFKLRFSRVSVSIHS